MIINMILNSLKSLVSRVVKLEQNSQDTGWQTATLQNCTANSNGLGGQVGIKYRKIGKKVYIKGSISTTWSGNGGITLAVLPAGYRPLYPIYNLVNLTGHNLARIGMMPSGTIFLDWVKAVSNGANITTALGWLAIDLEFLVD